MKRLLKQLTAAALTLAMAAALAACGGASGKLNAVRKAGKLVVFTDANFPPFEYNGNNGEIVGVDIEVAKAIAAELGVSVEFKQSDFDAIITAVKGGKADMAVSGFTITEERQKSVDFSQPYINSAQYLILLEGQNDITVMEDLAGREVGVAKGYSGQFWIEDELAEGGALYNTGASTREYNSAMDAALDLKAGRIEAVVMDGYVALNIADKNAGLKAIPLLYANGDEAAEQYGVVLAKGNEDLLAIVNGVLDKLIAEKQIEGWVVRFSE